MKNVKKILKIAIDILMYIDFIYLMSYGTVRMLFNHAIFGIALFALFIFHHILNIWFYKTTFKGKYTARRVTLSVTAWILFLLMILMAISSVLMSGAVFEFSPFIFSQIAKNLHVASTSWGFMVMSFHLALHMSAMFTKIEKSLKVNCSLMRKAIIFAVYVAIMATGIFAFIKTELYVYLFNLNMWKVSSSSALAAIAEYCAITLTICCLVHVSRCMSHRARAK